MAVPAQHVGYGPWVECDGKACPVAGGVHVQVWFRHDRDERAAVNGNHPLGQPARGWSWVHDGGMSDVVACREVL